MWSSSRVKKYKTIDFYTFQTKKMTCGLQVIDFIGVLVGRTRFELVTNGLKVRFKILHSIKNPVFTEFSRPH